MKKFYIFYNTFTFVKLCIYVYVFMCLCLCVCVCLKVSNKIVAINLYALLKFL